MLFPQLRRIDRQTFLTLSTSHTIWAPFTSVKVQPPIRRSLPATGAGLEVKPIRLGREILPITSITSVHERADMYASLSPRSGGLLESKLLPCWLATPASPAFHVFDVDDFEIFVGA